MGKPTDEQIKEFWEWCGFKRESRWSDPADIVPKHEYDVWVYPEGGKVTQHLTVNPSIDLNNLFKYAADLAIQCIAIDHSCSLELARYILFKHWLENIEKGLDPALALFWAIYEVFNGSTSSHKEE